MAFLGRLGVLLVAFGLPYELFLCMILSLEIGFLKIWGLVIGGKGVEIWIYSSGVSTSSASRKLTGLATPPPQAAPSLSSGVRPRLDAAIVHHHCIVRLNTARAEAATIKATTTSEPQV